MKLAVALLLIGMAGLLPAAEKNEKKSRKSVAPPQANAIPSTAVADGEGNYRYTDKQGKKWIYHKTPFGIQKMEDKPFVAVAPLHEDPTTAVVDGDTVRFERPTMFGGQKWQKKRSDLTSEERAILDRNLRNTAAKEKKPE